MRRMFMIYNCESLHNVLGKITIRFCDNYKDLIPIYKERDCALALAEFEGQIPTAFLVEEYVKRADLTGVRPHYIQTLPDPDYDWVFTRRWIPPMSREEAYEAIYGKIRETHQQQ